jgi:hypothetical protein
MGLSERHMKRAFVIVASALAIAAAACNALVGLDTFEKYDCAHCIDAGFDADANSDAPASDAPPPPIPIPDGAAAVSWAQWPMPSPEAGPNLFSYTVNGDGSVTDGKTGLVWLTGFTNSYGPADDTAKGFDRARAYCASVGDAGTKWRLPTRIELVTLIDYSKNAPALHPVFAPGLSGGWYWSSSVVRPVEIPYRFWAVNFTTGEVSDTALNDPRTALCVKQ